ncbi:MAG: histidine phosphatase family protein [Rhodobacteraceae bacterium]|nr:histidine phosphatase family protein [Paracoccaceae bacterium]
MTRRLILLRHAKSSWSDTSMPDHDRVLNGRGRRAATAVGRWLAEKGYRPDQVLCSPAVRTRETWQRISDELPDAPQATLIPGLYLGEPVDLFDALTKATGRCVALLAHNPGIGDFAGRILAAAPDHPDFRRYPTLATLVADFPIDDWSALEFGTGQAVDFVVPRALTDG